MDENFKFRSGKHAGKTIAEVRKIEPSYIRWVQENQPAMLRPTINYKQTPKTPTPAPPRREPPPDPEENEDDEPKGLQENYDFLKQGPLGNGE